MDVKPRKTPRQARAKVTVDAIVEATTQVLLIETLLEALAHRLVGAAPAPSETQAIAAEARRLITRYLSPAAKSG